jgi:tRNA U54 and U55 pseudouridine synthase Pus10
MSGYVLHFGCRIYHPENAKLTRENYAEINKRTRRNSFFSNRSYFKDMEIDEANECYWDMFQKYKLADYFKEMEQFLSYREKLKDVDYREVELSMFIEQQISQRIKDEEWHNDLFFLNSLDPIKKEFGKKIRKNIRKKFNRRLMRR